MHGQFVWYELMTPDAAAARNFYAPITNWGTQPFDANYTMWTSEGVPIGGLNQLGAKERAQGIPPNWMPYVESSNVADTVRLASSLGARIIEGPRDIPGAGTFAVIEDPQSAVFGVYDSKGQQHAWDGRPVVGRFSWHELMTSDHASAFDFYKRLFGWEKTGEMDMGGGNTYLMYGKGGQPYGGVFTRPPEMAGMHPFWLCYIHVKDVHRAVETATRNGAFVQRPPMDIPGGKIAILGDPQGAAFAVHHVSAAAAAPRSTARKSAKPASKTRTKAAKKAPSRTGSGKKKRAATATKRTSAPKPAKRSTAKRGRTGGSRGRKRR
jgi:predicted enzyme related to lactoylglutathione lyase